MPAPRRPTSITVIGWFLAVAAVVSLVTLTMHLRDAHTQAAMMRSVVPMRGRYALLYVDLLVSFACAVAVLHGHNWGRVLYTVWGFVGTFVGLVTAPRILMALPGITVYVVIVFFLFRPAANRYFASGTGSAPADPSPGDVP